MGRILIKYKVQYLFSRTEDLTVDWIGFVKQRTIPTYEASGRFPSRTLLGPRCGDRISSHLLRSPNISFLFSTYLNTSKPAFLSFSTRQIWSRVSVIFAVYFSERAHASKETWYSWGISGEGARVSVSSWWNWFCGWPLPEAPIHVQLSLKWGTSHAAKLLRLQHLRCRTVSYSLNAIGTTIDS